MTNQGTAVARRRNGVPASPPEDRSLPERILRSPWTWVTLGMTVLYAAALIWLFMDITAHMRVSAEVEGVNVSAITHAAQLALPTVLFWTVVFIAVDRFRPQRLMVWYLTFGWGAAAAVFAAYYINSWAASHLAIAGSGDPASGARAAIFVAPFVEEACKATVIFLLAIFARYRLTSKLSTITLAGLAAAGFAFTENIVYYARVIVYSSSTASVGDADAALANIVFLRGFVTAFGHPLFTLMTGIGIAVAVRTHSKVVRVAAPLAGYSAAVFGHMLFNSQVTISNQQTQLILYFAVALPLVLAVATFAVRQIFVESRRLRARLTDYVQLGWLPASDPEIISRGRRRLWALMVAVTDSGASFLATLRLQRALTELAYLRDGQVRGIVDGGSIGRERELVEYARQLRTVAIADPRGMKLTLPRWRSAKPLSYGRSDDHGFANYGTGRFAPQGDTPVGSQFSSARPQSGPPAG